MTSDNLIDKLNTAKDPTEIFDNISDWKSEYKSISKLIHPDISTNPGATSAFAKLNELKDILINGKKHNDDAGVVKYFADRVEIYGEPNILKHSLNNFNLLKSLKGEGVNLLQKYIPASGVIDGDKLTFTLSDRAVPLSVVDSLEQKHVNWILSRSYEFICFLNRFGYTHAGITPDSIYVVPKTHGIICISFYHMVKLNSKLSTVSSKYKYFYPPKLFTEKLAVSSVDIDLVKRLGIYLLGDKSGVGVKLRKSHKLDIIEFLQKPENDTIQSWQTWRGLLKKHFDLKQFYELNI